MIYYYQAYYQRKLGAFVEENLTINRENDGATMGLCQKAYAENNKDIIDTLYEKAEQCAPDYCFPNKLEDIAVLEHAIALWEQSIMLDASYPTVHRNLAIAYYNKRQNAEAARKELEQAFALDETDSRVFLELDQLYKKLGVPFAERLKQYEAREALVRERDDAMLEWVTLYNLNGEPQKAYDLIMSHSFRPWEGAEGRISGQYKIALTALAREAMQQNDYERAEQLLKQALQYPENLGEGRLEGTKDNDIYYEFGVVQEHLNRQDEAQKYFELAQIGDNEPAGAMYYYDQPADMILYQALIS